MNLKEDSESANHYTTEADSFNACLLNYVDRRRVTFTNENKFGYVCNIIREKNSEFVFLFPFKKCSIRGIRLYKNLNERLI